MKYYIYTVLLLLLTASCSDDVQKWDQWPEWKLASPLSVGGQVLDEEIYSNFQGKKLHLEKGQEVEFSGIDEIESILSPDYFRLFVLTVLQAAFPSKPLAALLLLQGKFLFRRITRFPFPVYGWFCPQSLPNCSASNHRPFPPA